MMTVEFFLVTIFSLGKAKAITKNKFKTRDDIKRKIAFRMMYDFE